MFSECRRQASQKRRKLLTLIAAIKVGCPVHGPGLCFPRRQGVLLPKTGLARDASVEFIEAPGPARHIIHSF